MEVAARKPLRIWPCVVIAVLLAFTRYVLPLFGSSTLLYSVFGGFVLSAGVVLWWLFFSRARWVERLAAIALMAIAFLATKLIVDPSIATGAMGFLFPMLATPVLGIAFVAVVAATRNLADGPRRAAMAATILTACGSIALIRTGGFDGSFKNDLH